MERQPFSFAQHWEPWDVAAGRLEQGDRFCSSPTWGLPLIHAFHLPGDLVVYRQGEDLAVFYERQLPGGRLITPCDTMWMLGSPLLARQPAAFLERLADFWQSQPGLKQVTVSGPFLEHPLWNDPVWQRWSCWEVEAGARQVASLEGGLDGFLSRRSVNFRSRLRRAVKRAEREGVEVEWMPRQANAATALAVLDRAMQVESLSWKGLAGQGVHRGQMNSFYRRMVPLLAQRGRLRGLFLRRGSQDLSYLLGGVFAGTFRGLQFSYLESESEGLGNVGQWRMLEALVEEGCHSYDLGQAMPYKARWAEQHRRSGARIIQIPGAGRA